MYIKKGDTMKKIFTMLMITAVALTSANAFTCKVKKPDSNTSR